MIGTYVIGYLISVMAPSLLGYLTLEPAYILRGQVWRLVTWLFIPPSRLDLFTIIMLFFYYSIGSNMEHAWGSFRYNVYIFTGILFSIAGAFVVYFILGGQVLMGGAISTYYINMSIFLAFAATYPDMQVMLYFIIPLKVKWMGLVYGAIIVYNGISSSWPERMLIVASLLNFIIFFMSTRNLKRVMPGEIKRKQKFKKAVSHPQMQYRTGDTITKHKCAICGRTELDGDELEFRFCSKCEGNYEYCQNHLFTHEHIKRH